MPDVLEQAPSGRAKCRGCGRGIAKGEWRFGEALPNPFAEGEALYWFHPICAACMRPEKLAPALAASSAALPERDWMLRTAEFGIAHRRLPRLLRAEIAPSGRAHCRNCREVIEKGSWRLALQIFEDGRFNPAGSIHVACSEAYFGTRELEDRLYRLCPDLEPGAFAEIARLLAPPRLAKTEPEESLDEMRRSENR